MGQRGALLGQNQGSSAPLWGGGWGGGVSGRSGARRSSPPANRLLRSNRNVGKKPDRSSSVADSQTWIFPVPQLDAEAALTVIEAGRRDPLTFRAFRNVGPRLFTEKTSLVPAGESKARILKDPPIGWFMLAVLAPANTKLRILMHPLDEYLDLLLLVSSLSGS